MRKLNFKLQNKTCHSPRLMSVTGMFAGDCHKYQIVCGHAPCEDAKPAANDIFWDKVLAVCSDMRSRCPTALLFLLLDANGRTSSGGCFGEVEPNEENDNGERLRHCLQSVNLAAFNTFFPVGCTWRSAHGPTDPRLASTTYVATQVVWIRSRNVMSLSQSI